MTIQREWYFNSPLDAGFRYLIDGEVVTKREAVAAAEAQGVKIKTFTNRPAIK